MFRYTCHMVCLWSHFSPSIFSCIPEIKLKIARLYGKGFQLLSHFTSSQIESCFSKALLSSSFPPSLSTGLWMAWNTLCRVRLALDWQQLCPCLLSAGITSCTTRPAFQRFHNAYFVSVYTYGNRLTSLDDIKDKQHKDKL